jgi:hypothetical protein
MLGKESDAANHVQAAIADRNLAAEHNLPIPSMPAELGTAPKAAVAAAPTTAPTEATADAAEDPDFRAAVTAFGEALDKADLEAAKAAVQIEPGQEAYFETAVAQVGELKKFVAAVKEKFPEQADALTKMIPDMATALKQVKLTVNGDEGFAQRPGMEAEKFGVRADGKWKVFIGAPQTEQAKMQRAMQEKFGNALPQLTADIQAGKYATLEDLSKGMMEAMGMGAPGAQPAP